jgi:hypothetical protein
MNVGNFNKIHPKVQFPHGCYYVNIPLVNAIITQSNLT